MTKRKPQKPQNDKTAQAAQYKKRLTTTSVTVIANAQGQIINLVQVGEPITLLEIAALLRAGGDQAIAAHVRQEEQRKVKADGDASAR